MENRLTQVYAFNGTYFLTELIGYYFDSKYNIFSDKGKSGKLRKLKLGACDTEKSRPTISLYQKSYHLEDLVLGSYFAKTFNLRFSYSTDTTVIYEMVIPHMYMPLDGVIGCNTYTTMKRVSIDTLLAIQLVSGYSITYLDGDIKNIAMENMRADTMISYYAWCRNNKYKPVISNTHKRMIYALYHNMRNTVILKYNPDITDTKIESNTSTILKISKFLNIDEKTIRVIIASCKKFM